MSLSGNEMEVRTDFLLAVHILSASMALMDGGVIIEEFQIYGMELDFLREVSAWDRYNLGNRLQ